ncbi:hypothetical protein [Urbifossiella limnaea]|uniref:Uncharacterized protein n=1 Tax=Urbifossiella limnaea TaxID=2528023 RepID=A0A517XKZ1_9BACT|nr:hypothetical protein [Urbifossiella limnaea]QDU18160.1 hypothetical protein ETAA1_00430 [Urbifossiella limnaea]
MRNPGRRIRGAIGTGLAWGTWLGAGVLVARVPGVDSDLPFVYQFAPFGILSGVIFSEALVAIERRRRLDRVSLSLAAGWGAVSGLLSAVVVAALRGDVSEVLVFGPVLALAGAACAAGTLALARRPERAPLAGPGGSTAA